jgi:hypothetical protein
MPRSPHRKVEKFHRRKIQGFELEVIKSTRCSLSESGDDNYHDILEGGSGGKLKPTNFSAFRIPSTRNPRLC